MLASRGSVVRLGSMASAMNRLAPPMGAAAAGAAAAAVGTPQQQQRQRRQRHAVAAAAAATEGTSTSTSSDGGSPSNKAGQAVAPPDIPALARMAHIAVTEQEVADWGPKIASIVGWFGQLQAADVAGVAPALHAREDEREAGGVAGAAAGLLRADEPRAYAARAALLQQVPEMQGAFVRAPKIGTGADATSSSSGSSATSSVDGSSSSSTSASAASSTATAAPAASSSSSDANDAEGAAAAAAAAAVDLSAPVTGEELAALQALDLRVGRVVACERHPDADTLYVEQVDCGDAEGPRTIVSGLVKYVPLEQMVGRAVVVLANLKPRKMRGVTSAGMLLAASNDAHDVVEPLAPPEGAAPGTRLHFGGHADQPAPLAPNSVAKKRCWERVQPLLRTDAARAANCKGLVLMAAAGGPVTSATLAGARIG